MAAKNILRKYFGEDPVNFDKLFSKADHDLLRPLGKYVGVKSIPDDACSEEENPTPLIIRLERNPHSGAQAVHISKDSSSSQEPLSDVNSDTVENEEDIFHNPFGMDIDDFLPDSAKEIEQNAEPEIFSRFLIVDGKEFFKNFLYCWIELQSFKESHYVNTLKWRNGTEGYLQFQVQAQ